MPRFLYLYIAGTLTAYLKLIRTGLNIQAEEIERYPIEFPIRDDMRNF